ncbi:MULTISPECIES: complex I subunit 5 family protein [Halomonadaceae]|uniref:complex I subunit 5 family protein n=1 Tax=Halomonadaceae TaxID=28256 RepID=UPI00159789C9|nr:MULTISPECIES: proton-conducting transporter membrane subunit [Halomonas]QJQ94868.1 hypothetical protein HIO72_05965 [Halomonas sp. PA5]
MALLHADGLALLLVSFTTVVVAASALYGFHYFRETDDTPRRLHLLWPLLALLWLSLCTLWLSRHLLLLYAALEVVGLCAVALMSLPGTDKSRKAGKRYLICTLCGSAALIVGLGLVHSLYGSFDLHLLADIAPARSHTALALALLSGGLMLKVAVFPMHGWLPPAHGAAWVPVSAVHAALVIKAGFFVMLRFWNALLPDAVLAAQFLGALGALAIIWGSLLAWRQSEFKSVVAYSTVAQIGYLLLLFPLITGTSERVATLAWESTWLLVVSHALAKAAAFMSAGNLVLTMGRGDLAGLPGVGRQVPLSLLVFGLASLTLMGLPPSGGFVAKYMLLQAAMISGQWQWALVVALGSLLSAAYVFRVFRYCFLEAESQEGSYTPPLSLDLIPLALAIAATAMGLFAGWPLALLQWEGPA